MKISTCGFLKRESPLRELFPEGKVPLVTLVPMQPNPSAPLCYLFDAKVLPEDRLHALAKRLFKQWQPEMQSVEEAVKYIREGLPIACDHFSGAQTTDPRIAMNAMAYAKQENYDIDFSDGSITPI